MGRSVIAATGRNHTQSWCQTKSGFHVTFVNTKYNHRRLTRSGSAIALDGLPSFRFANIPDGHPLVYGDATQDAWLLCESIPKNCLAPFRYLLSELKTSEGVLPVSCVVSDGVMSFTLEAAEELGVPNVLFWTTSACGFLAYAYYCQLVEKGFVPLKGTWTDRVHQVLDILSKPNQVSLRMKISSET